MIWSPLTRLAFRFCFAYFGIQTAERWLHYVYPSWIPFQPPNLYSILIHRPLAWMGIDAGVLCPWCGSVDGDEMMWIEMGWVAVLAALATACWSLLDRKRLHYRRLHELLRLDPRYWLAMAMWMYGWAKVSVPQFGYGQEGLTLLTPLGGIHGSYFLWDTMGFSQVFALFTAVGELAAAVLVLWRRATTLGAMIIVAIMADSESRRPSGDGCAWRRTRARCAPRDLGTCRGWSRTIRRSPHGDDI